MVVGFWRLSTMEPGRRAPSSARSTCSSSASGSASSCRCSCSPSRTTSTTATSAWRPPGRPSSARSAAASAWPSAARSSPTASATSWPASGGTCRPRWRRATSRAIRSRSCRPPRSDAFVGAYADALQHRLPRLRADRGGRLRARLAAAREAAAAHGRGHRRRRGVRGAQAPRPAGRDRARALDAGAPRQPRADPRAPGPAGRRRADGAPVLGPRARGRGRADGCLRDRRARTRSTRRAWRRASPSCASSATSRGPREAVVLTAAGRDVARAARGRPSRAPGRAARRLVARARGRARRAAHAHGARRRRRPSRRRSAAPSTRPPRRRTGRRPGLDTPGGRRAGGCRLRPRHGGATVPDRGLRRRRVLDGRRQPAARRLRPGPDRGRAPARVLRAHGVGRRRPLRRALLPHLRRLRLRAQPPLALPPRPHRGDRRPRRAPARAGPHLRRAAARSSACSAPGARTGSTSRWPRRGGAASCSAGSAPARCAGSRRR